MKDDDGSLQQLFEQLPPEGAARLERILDRMYSGSPTDLRTPFYSGNPREEILEALEEKVGFTEFIDLTEIEKHEKEKVGPYSIMVPYADRKDDISEYWKQSWNPDEAALEEAVFRIANLLPDRSLRPASLDTAYGLMPSDTSLGLPWMSRDRQYAEEYLERARVICDISEIFPAVLGWRGQPRGLFEIPKQRTVWMMDHVDTILSATILYPLLDTLKQLPGFRAWVDEYAVDEACTRILQKANGRRIISSDYSGFDQKVPRQLQQIVDNYWCSKFIPDASNTINLLGEICATIPIVVPYRVLSGRNGGIASGTGLTNIRGSMVNRITGEYIAVRAGCDLEDSEVLGDDSIFLFTDELDSEEIAAYASELGLEMNPEKQFVSSRAVHYLQRWHSLDYMIDGSAVGVHTPYRSASGWMGYERFRNDWSKYMDTTRWIMQTENCHNHPNFRSIVDFMYHGDKLLLSGIDPRTVFAKAGGSDKIRSILSISSFPYNSRDPDKVEEFETTKLIREFQAAM